MRKQITILMSAIMMAGCATGSKEATSTFVKPTLTDEEKSAGVFTAEVMWKMGRVGSETLSPDGETIAYTTSYYDLATNGSTTLLMTVPYSGGEPKVIVEGASSPTWSSDGGYIYYISSKSGSSQLWRVRPSGKRATQISDIAGGIEGYGVSPDGTKMWYAQQVAVEKRLSSEIYDDMDKSKARIYDDLMVRHWTYWDEGKHMHIFISNIRNDIANNGVDIMPGEAWDAPTAPYFDMGEIAWNNASTMVAYTCKKLTGTEYAVSTDSDIFLYDIAAGTTHNICKGDEPTDPRMRMMPQMGGYDKYPVFSADDSKIAFRSMRRPGNESDRDRLMVWDSATGAMTEMTATFDNNAMNVIWQGEELFFISPIQATHQICKVGTDMQVNVLTEGDHDINSMSMASGRTVANMASISQAAELYAVEDGKLRQITFTNQEFYDNLAMGEVQKRWVETTDGKKMLTWVILPPNFDESKKYPTLLYCQGGPQSVVSQFWSYRWNFQLMAAQDYIIVAPNRRGLPSFGTEWLDQISGDYSGQNIKDYLSAIDDVAKEPWSDETKLGAVGASYGGYSVYYLAGHHEGRFKALISHCGIFNFDSMYGETEELWFVNRDYGGSYWDKENATAQRSYANSPHKAAGDWDTPILIFTGEYDYRIPFTQSLQAFTAARTHGIPSRLVVFEDEGHQVFKPQNNVVWNREFFGWLDKYLK